MNPGGIQPEDRQLHTSVLGPLSPAFRARASTLLASVYRDPREKGVPPGGQGGSRCGCGLVVDGPGVGRGAQVGTFAFYPRIPIAISHSFEKSIP
ncbi:MAG: hypothetical protein RLZZ458_3257, partial [Planctomycetota bacterium]